MVVPEITPGLDEITVPVLSTKAIVVDPANRFSLKVKLTWSGTLESEDPSVGVVETSSAWAEAGLDPIVSAIMARNTVMTRRGKLIAAPSIQ